MQKIKHIHISPGSHADLTSGRPAIPFQGRQLFVDERIMDPSAVLPQGARYPIPAFTIGRIAVMETETV